MSMTRTRVPAMHGRPWHTSGSAVMWGNTVFAAVAMERAFPSPTVTESRPDACHSTSARRTLRGALADPENLPDAVRTWVHRTSEGCPLWTQIGPNLDPSCYGS